MTQNLPHNLLENLKITISIEKNDFIENLLYQLISLILFETVYWIKFIHFPWKYLKSIQFLYQLAFINEKPM